MAEDLRVLYENNESTRGRIIATGALNFMKSWRPVTAGRWYSIELLVAILAGCLLCAAFVVLAVVPVMMTLAHGDDATCRLFGTSSGRENQRPANIYFLKHENRSWTNDELCYIETAARRYSDHNIFMINLLEKDDLTRGTQSPDYSLESLISSGDKNVIDRRDGSSGEITLIREMSKVTGINNIDISIDKFFARSIMAKRILDRDISYENIEVAARFHLIWNNPGISLEPTNIYELEHVSHLFHTTKTDLYAVIELEVDLQASAVPCQQFVGHVLREIARNNFDERQLLLTRALSDYCSSLVECPGVRIVMPTATKSPNFTTCPIVDYAGNISVAVGKLSL